MQARFLRTSASIAAIVLFATAAHAQGPYSLTGKTATGNGQTVRLPGQGVPCADLTANVLAGINAMQKYRVPPSALSMNVVVNPAGCIPGSASSVTTTGSGGFMLPVMFFNIPPPGSIQVVPVPQNLNVPQFATSFGFTGPAYANTPFEPQNPRKAGTPKFTPATWNLFRANAHLKPGASSYGSFSKTVSVQASGTATPSMGATSMQARAYLNKYVSGRTSANFTACAQTPGMAANVPCTFPTQGTIPGVVKNIAGPRVFGGTVGLVLSSGTNLSSVAVTVAGGYSSPGGMNTMATRGSILFNPLMGMGSRPQGRGYAAYDTDNLSAATIFTSHMLTTIYMSLPYYSRVVGGVGLGGIMLPSGTNRNHGFPWTTGTQIIRATGKTLNGAPGGGTFSLMGFDSRVTPMGATGMGGVGTIQLVAGGIAQALPLSPFAGTENYSIMRLEFAPEPRGAAGLIAGVATLLGLVAWSRRRR